MKDCFFSWN